MKKETCAFEIVLFSLLMGLTFHAAMMTENEILRTVSVIAFLICMFLVIYSCNDICKKRKNEV